MRALIATLTALMLFAATPVVAGDYEDGVAAARARNYEKAIRLWKRLAEQGLADAQANLGVMDQQGWGIPKDAAKAVSWYRKGGDPTALRFCLSRILPVKRERTIELDLPALEGSQDSLRAIGTVLEAVGAGAITPS